MSMDRINSPIHDYDDASMNGILVFARRVSLGVLIILLFLRLSGYGAVIFGELFSSYEKVGMYLYMACFFFVEGLTILHLLAKRAPTKTKLVDAILLFVCKPDDAEVAAGDLLEELEKVKARHGSWYCNIWFTWELALLVLAKGRARFTKSVFGPVMDLLKRKSS